MHLLFLSSRTMKTMFGLGHTDAQLPDSRLLEYSLGAVILPMLCQMENDNEAAVDTSLLRGIDLISYLDKLWRYQPKAGYLEITLLTSKSILVSEKSAKAVAILPSVLGCFVGPNGPMHTVAQGCTETCVRDLVEVTGHLHCSDAPQCRLQSVLDHMPPIDRPLENC